MRFSSYNILFFLSPSHRRSPPSLSSSFAQPLRPCAPAPSPCSLARPAPARLLPCSPARLRPCSLAPAPRCPCTPAPSPCTQPHLAHRRSPSPSLAQPPRTVK
ncbi:hypothetical protein ACOSQ3_019596 [Xanthoceras sorbifolium]